MNNPLKSDLACDLFNKNQHNTNNTTTHHTESIYGYDIIHTEIIDSQKRENLKTPPCVRETYQFLQKRNWRF